MLVIAKARGYFDGIREPGDKFNVPDGEKATWFEPVEKPKEVKESPAKGEKKEATKDEGAGKKEGEGASDPK
jgi:hypothetical protein